MDAQFQGWRKTKLSDGKSNYGQILLKFSLKLREIAPVIDSLVETPGKLWSDGLDRNSLDLNHR